ncbi:hypothetical protein D3C87_1615690 [compost metagenome]
MRQCTCHHGKDGDAEGGDDRQECDITNLLKARANDDHCAYEPDATGGVTAPTHGFFQEDARQDGENDRLDKEDRDRVCDRHDCQRGDEADHGYGDHSGPDRVIKTHAPGKGAPRPCPEHEW